MKILVSNDDGIGSVGINLLVEELRKVGDVVVIAPATEQSAAGHSITMKNPLRVKEHFVDNKFFGYAINGTPADCVKIGIKNILEEKPDLVISGINNGSNAAINVIYSGTVSAAREAAIMDVPAMAISVDSHTPKHYEYAAKLAKKLAKFICEKKLRTGTLLNVNVPDLPEEEIAGISVTRQGETRWDDFYEERIDPYGEKYYWLTGKMDYQDIENDRDVIALKNGYVSITPVHFDLTDFTMLETMKNWELDSIK
ncbi:MAG: 5'/3'-nucleotidase SurE [Melioribacteraceae bacterium]|nr:5'/3'-nucleotidase SurE [Melioribacteraceae bacterium]